MANEIRTIYSDPTKQVYCTIRKLSDLQVYNFVDEGFENWLDANIAEYNVDLTNQDGDLFTADHPDISVDTYMYTFYIRDLLTSPAITDTRIDAIEASWNGSNVVPPSGSVILSPYAICTLEELKRELNITSEDYDDLLRQYINQATYIFETEANRKIAARLSVETIREFNARITTSIWPIVYVKRIGWNYENTFSLISTASGIDTLVRISEDNMVITFIDADGDETDYTYGFSTYKSVNALQAAIISDGISVTMDIEENVQTKFLKTIAGVSIVEEQDFEFADMTETQYKVYEKQGIISLPEKDLANDVTLEYYAGFETIPPDICKAGISMCKNMYELTGGSTNLKSASLDGYSYSLGGDTMNTIIDISAQQTIDSYASSVIATSTNWR